MRMQLKELQDSSQEATKNFEKEARKLDQELRLRKEQQHKVRCLEKACVHRTCVDYEVVQVAKRMVFLTASHHFFIQADTELLQLEREVSSQMANVSANVQGAMQETMPMTSDFFNFFAHLHLVFAPDRAPRT